MNNKANNMLSTIETLDKPNTQCCKHFVTRKKRFCKMTVKVGKFYCGEHQPVENNDDNIDKELQYTKQRIKCPLDPTHSCYTSKLKKHLKVCNAKVISLPPYITKGINQGEAPTEIDSKISLNNISVEVLKETVEKLRKIYNDIAKLQPDLSTWKSNVLDAELGNESYGKQKQKHLLQTASLLGQLEKENFLGPDTCFIEFGGGKGHMTFWLATVIKDVSNTTVVLIDKASHRHKQDNKLKDMDDRVHRVRADIGDLELSKLEYVQKSRNTIGIGKHLCGAATDLAFRCMENNKASFCGIVLAFCCHHRCQWSSYTGKDFLKKYEINESQFNILCSVTSWATSGTGMSREKRTEMEHRNTEKIETDCEPDKRDESFIPFSQSEREEIGRCCKFILDYGRTLYLEQHGFLCKLTYYVEKHITPENLCIIAKRKGDASKHV